MQSENSKSIWLKIYGDNPIENLRRLSNEERLELAKDALEGGAYPAGEDVFEEKHLFYCWLHWIESDDPLAIMWWHWVGARNDSDINSRDQYIIKLWHTINDKDTIQAVNRKAKEYVETKITTWSYFEQHFFNWFLGRFNVVDARQVFNKHWISRYIHLPVSLVTTALAIWYFGLSCNTSCDWLLSLLSIVLVFTLGNVFAWIKPAYYIQSLVPRLAVTTAIGYLFLFSANGLVTWIYKNQLNLKQQVGIALTLVILVLFYMVQIIQRRVQPRLKVWPSFTRSLHLMLMAIAYSAVGLLISAPILFDPLFISLADRSLSAPPAGYGYLLITAAIALAIGVALQLVWEDRPVTEPL